MATQLLPDRDWRLFHSCDQQLLLPAQDMEARQARLALRLREAALRRVTHLEQIRDRAAISKEEREACPPLSPRKASPQKGDASGGRRLPQRQPALCTRTSLLLCVDSALSGMPVSCTA